MHICDSYLELARPESTPNRGNESLSSWVSFLLLNYFTCFPADHEFLCSLILAFQYFHRFLSFLRNCFPFFTEIVGTAAFAIMVLLSQCPSDFTVSNGHIYLFVSVTIRTSSFTWVFEPIFQTLFTTIILELPLGAKKSLIRYSLHFPDTS